MIGMEEGDTDMAVVESVNLSDPKLYINRQLSWLEFNERVLEQAKDKRHPLLERARFLAISETNLDEFFMIRVAGLQKQVATERPATVADGTTPEEQLVQIHSRISRFYHEQRRILHEELVPELHAAGVHLVPYDELDSGRKEELRRRFEREMQPILTPLAVDPAHPFPHISNLSLNLLVVIRDRDRDVMARVKVPNTATTFLRLSMPDSPPISAVPQTPSVTLGAPRGVIAANLDELFPDITSSTALFSGHSQRGPRLTGG
jgi:polyphosphate kinase